jgi:hypothetical protein
MYSDTKFKLQEACRKYFEFTHPGCIEYTQKHPNQYFNMSMKYYEMGPERMKAEYAPKKQNDSEQHKQIESLSEETPLTNSTIAKSTTAIVVPISSTNNESVVCQDLEMSESELAKL